ncbi:hypothetical protein HYALB_00010993 [Hymenoscyphus albidus]|uniref:Uncharacterized protein n=1 Tax=Hymenoscyphus albidus TaxID=595503 RepID=A0A9N9LBK1_9HELO|nr:hypothetical protein HYALB_00010993 [Hymenoscyphus albidus]
MVPKILPLDKEEQARIRREERAKNSIIVRQRDTAFEIYKNDTPRCSYEEFRELEINNRLMANIYLGIALDTWRVRYNKFVNFPLRKRAFENYKRDNPDTRFQGMSDLMNIDHPLTDTYFDHAARELEAEEEERKEDRRQELREKKGWLQRTWFRLVH